MKKIDLKLTGIIVGIIMAFIIVSIIFIKGVENKAITYEESIESAEASVTNEEQRRIDLFNNLVDAIESYNKYEGPTQEKIVEARNQNNKGETEEAEKTLNVVVEQYPDLKSQANYQTVMKEFSVTENRLTSSRENYNNRVKVYNRYVRKFPSKQLLSLQGYEVPTYNYIEFEVDNSKAVNLFDN